jgi:hypothetical protein
VAKDGPVTDSCIQGNKTSRLVKDGNFLSSFAVTNISRRTMVHGIS